MAIQRVSLKVSPLSKQLLDEVAGATNQKQYKVLEVVLREYLDNLTKRKKMS